MSNRKPFIDPSMFTKPPPNFNKTSSLQRDEFKIPNLPLKKKPPFNKASLQDYPTNSRNSMAYRNYSHTTQSPTTSRSIQNSPHVKFNLNLDRRMYSASSGSVARNYPSPQTKPDLLLRNYKNTPPPNSAAPPPNVLKNFKNDPPPNYISQKSSVQLPPGRKKDIVFNPVGLIQPQPFKPNVPPPQINKSLQQNHQYRVPMKPSPNNVQNNVYNRPKEVYWSRAPGYPHSLAPFSPSSILPSQLNLPPPQHLPPLPPGAPPRNPPPPPVSPPFVITLNASSAQGMSYLHNNMQINSGHSSMSYENHQLEHQSPENNLDARETSTSYNYNLKRKFENSPNDFHKKKKKRPLSQMPQRINWSIEEAKKALDVELSCNRTARKQSLIIKFPDLELNRDIVTSFHSSIQHVHFQQPSTARYCFVTLADSADPETVISQINRIPFGLGYLTAEFKKERDDEHNLKSTDIDPLTLYVGNLGQEVTKDDMTKTFPKQKRIDIGYAKKMKYTRYAFVSFYTVDDAIEAFKKTHLSQMYSKSLIVRFRRLHGTVGMPGEPKPVMTPRVFNGTLHEPEIESENNPWDIDVSHWGDYSVSDDIPEEEYEEESWKMKPFVKFQTRLRTGLLENEFLQHRPKFMKIKGEMDYEVSEDTDYQSLYDQRESEDEFSCSATEFSCSETEFSCPETELTCPVTPQTPENELNSEHDVIDDETTDSQEFKCGLDIKQEGIKQESLHLGTTRFRVLTETVRPSSSLVVNVDDNKIREHIKAEEDYNISSLWKESSTNDSQIKHNEQCSPVYSGSNNFKNSSNVQLFNTQKQIISATSEDINQSIVPVPMIIKIEDEKNSDLVHGQLSGNSSSNDQSDVQKSSSEQVLSEDGCDIQISAGNGSINNLVDKQNQSAANDDSQTENIDKEKDAQYQYEGENLSWMNVDYSSREIKDEPEEGDEDDDDDSSEDELSLENIRKKARGPSTVIAHIQ